MADLAMVFAALPHIHGPHVQDDLTRMIENDPEGRVKLDFIKYMN
jgi:hypothetical protein